MRSPYIKPYVESSVFIAFIKGEKSQGPTRDWDARAIFDSIIDAARARKFRIITSALTIAEVHKYKKYPKEQQVTQRQNEDLRPYFRQDYIQIVEIDREVGEKRTNFVLGVRPDLVIRRFVRMMLFTLPQLKRPAVM